MSEHTWNDVEILVVGAGTMGASLAQAYSQSGFTVGLLDIDGAALERGVATIDKELQRAAKSGIFSPAQAADIAGRVLATTSYEEACAGTALRLVIESATENLELKKRIFKQLDALCGPEVVLGSNSSSLSIDEIAAATGRPDKVVWMHYFYLPHKNRGGEYAGAAAASEQSIATAARYMKLAGKLATPILSSRKGGAADVLFVALLNEAARMADEGFRYDDIEAAGKTAFGIPMGFLALMDATGIQIGHATMISFSTKVGAHDPLVEAWGDFFVPPKTFAEIMDRYFAAEDLDERKAVRWLPKGWKAADPDPTTHDKLVDRFRGVGFATVMEIVDAGVIAMDEVDNMCRCAFLWRRGPLELMNRLGTAEVMRVIVERKRLADQGGYAFPMPKLFVDYRERNALPPFDESAVKATRERDGQVARITLSNPANANALDSEVFAALGDAFDAAHADDKVRVVVFETAPIKTFIAGANVKNFVDRIHADDHVGIRDETAAWQDILFHRMTGRDKPMIALVDGTALGGGVETAMAFAHDPNTFVIATERTSYTLPETRLGIYPGMRGTCLLPRLILRGTGDDETAVALSRYYTLAGGTPTSSPRILAHLGLVDAVVRTHRREDALDALAGWMLENERLPGACEIDGIGIHAVDTTLTLDEKEELRWMRDLFLHPNLIPTLYAYGLGWRDVPLGAVEAAFVKRVARRVAANSPNAVALSNRLIGEGYRSAAAGEPLDEIAARELDNLVPVFQHPDALSGLTALLERRFPEFDRTFPF